jgi:hypothetical protein
MQRKQKVGLIKFIRLLYERKLRKRRKYFALKMRMLLYKIEIMKVLQLDKMAEVIGGHRYSRE